MGCNEIFVGKTGLFAIEVGSICVVDGWLFGSFVFWINGEVIGDPEDKSVDLRACFNWIADFLNSSIDRCDLNFLHLGAMEVIKEIKDEIFSNNEKIDLACDRPYGYFRRFVVSHVGMSSFERYHVFFIECKDMERLIAVDENNCVSECYFDAGVFRSVLADAFSAFVVNGWR